MNTDAIYMEEVFVRNLAHQTGSFEEWLSKEKTCGNMINKTRIYRELNFRKSLITHKFWFASRKPTSQQFL